MRAIPVVFVGCFSEVDLDFFDQGTKEIVKEDPTCYYFDAIEWFSSLLILIMLLHVDDQA